jgi:thymidylate synthase
MVMSNIEKQYLKLLKDILKNGKPKGDRTGTGTISVYGRQIRHDMSKGFPLLTTKKVFWKGIVTELLWFLRGETNIKWLVENGNNIWVGDAYKNYVKTEEQSYQRMRNNPVLDIQPLELLSKEEFIKKIKTDDQFAEKWGYLGPVYGKQWRAWEKINYYDWGSFDKRYRRDKDVDQISNLISEIKTNPDSRRLMLTSWNVSDLDNMVLPPCHYGFQIYTRELTTQESVELLFNYVSDSNPAVRPDASFWELEEDVINEWLETYNLPKRKISLMWNQRSVDTFLGLPFNIASYALLLHIIAKEVGMIPDELIGNLGDVHLYNNHLKQAKEQINREPKRLPELHLLDECHYLFEYSKDDMDFGGRINELRSDMFIIDKYDPHPPIKAELSN